MIYTAYLHFRDVEIPILDRDGIHKLDVFSRKSLFSREKIGVNKENDLENRCIGPKRDR